MHAHNHVGHVPHDTGMLLRGHRVLAHPREHHCITHAEATGRRGGCQEVCKGRQYKLQCARECVLARLRSTEILVLLRD